MSGVDLKLVAVAAAAAAAAVVEQGEAQLEKQAVYS